MNLKQFRISEDVVDQTVKLFGIMVAIIVIIFFVLSLLGVKFNSRDCQYYYDNNYTLSDTPIRCLKELGLDYDDRD